MVARETYSAPYSGTIVAQDANNDINPSEIEAAVAAFQSKCETSFQSLVDKLEGVKPEACDAIVVQRTNIGGKMEEIASKITALSSQVGNQFSHLPALAMAKHDELQIAYNAEAESKAAAEWERYNSQQNALK